MTKYQTLADRLNGVEEESAKWTFKEIENTLGFPLPPSARRHAGWWSNHATGHVQAKAWLEAGWQAWEVDLKDERVLFRRVKSSGPPPTRSVGRAHSPGARVCVDIALLSPAAARLLREYRVEMVGDEGAALARAVHEAAIARRGRLIDQIIASAPRMPPGEPDSVQLIREGREERDGR